MSILQQPLQKSVWSWLITIFIGIDPLLAFWGVAILGCWFPQWLGTFLKISSISLSLNALPSTKTLVEAEIQRKHMDKLKKSHANVLKILCLLIKVLLEMKIRSLAKTSDVVNYRCERFNCPIFGQATFRPHLSRIGFWQKPSKIQLR
jgi:hypothetical protein